MNYAMLESRTLYVGNLSLYCSEQELAQLFLPFGTIESVHIKKSTNGGVSYAFLKYQTRVSAEHALQQMNGVLVHGRQLRVGWAAEYQAGKPVAPLPPSTKVNNPPPTAQIHVSFHSNSWNPVKESFLRSIFERFGDVRDVSIKKVQMNKETGEQTGYGFVHYSLDKVGILSSIRAVNGMNGAMVEAIHFTCTLSHSLSELIRRSSNLSMNMTPSTSHPISVSSQLHPRQFELHPTTYDIIPQKTSSQLDLYLRKITRDIPSIGSYPTSSSSSLSSQSTNSSVGIPPRKAVSFPTNCNEHLSLLSRTESFFRTPLTFPSSSIFDNTPQYHAEDLDDDLGDELHITSFLDNPISSLF